MHYIPPLRLRCSEETEIIGVDDAEMGEYAYDYVGVDLEIGPRQMYGDGASSIRGSMRQRREVNPAMASGYQFDGEAQRPLS